MKKKVFITKYALSTGIIECVMDVSTETKSCHGKLDGFAFNTVYYGSDFHLTKKEAIKDCEKRKEKKIRSLEKQLLRIMKLSF